MYRWQTIASIATVAFLAAPARGVAPSTTEFRQRDDWLAANLGRVVASSRPASLQIKPKAGLVVLANNGPVMMDGRLDGRAIKIGDKEFKRGMICHAMSKIMVKLPSGGKSFAAVAGVDANAGGGSVVFSVSVGGKTAFRSDVMRGSQPGIPVKVELGGTRDFVISASDAGDGIGCDHADWADARVTLDNGEIVWLSDLPIITPQLPERAGSVSPFSFVYGGKHSDELLPTWKFEETTKKLDEFRTQRSQVYTDPKTGLEVRINIVSYSDFPTAEWTVYFKNTSRKPTPILESIQGIDTRFARTGAGEFVLHHAVGSICQANDYQPLTEDMGPGVEKTIATSGGRSSNSDYPAFNIEWPGQGIIVALGWPGQWAAHFIRDKANEMRVAAGQEITYLKLMPGEQIRTPLVVLQFWNGDRVRSQNIWRRWMVAHNMPKPGGKPLYPEFGGCIGNPVPFAAQDVAQLKALAAEGVKLDHWIIDAGWYPSTDWTQTGTWEVDKKRFPKGLREVADVAHANGTDFIVWFEPERVAADTWLTENHPEWVLGGKGGGLLNLGNPKAWKWVTNRISDLLSSEGIDHYRSDYNIDPLSYWRANDAEDRQGITENLYVQGHLAFWDELERRHPNLYIDTCASGGRRNDIETLRRAVPMLRSDYPLTDFTITGAYGQQCQTYAISMWIPHFGTGEPASDMYTIRSGYSPIFRMGYDACNPTGQTKWYHQGADESRMLFPYWQHDFYPLTPYSLEKDVWMAWQFDSPENKGGFIQAFRRENNDQPSMQFRLQGLEPAATYNVTNLDKCTTDKLTGQSLMDEGIKIELAEKQSSALIIYRKAE